MDLFSGNERQLTKVYKIAKDVARIIHQSLSRRIRGNFFMSKAKLKIMRKMYVDTLRK